MRRIGHGNVVIRLSSELFLTVYRWDALFNCEFEDIEEWRRPHAKSEYLVNFRVRNWRIRNDPREIQKLRDKITAAGKKIRLGFSSGYHKSCRWYPDWGTRNWNFAVTTETGYWSVDVEDGAHIWLSVELFQPLMRDDLTDIERWDFRC
jgi:hypothetical protein